MQCKECALGMLASTFANNAEGRRGFRSFIPPKLCPSSAVLVLVKMFNIYVVKQLEILTLQQSKKAWPLILKALYALLLI